MFQEKTSRLFQNLLERAVAKALSSGEVYYDLFISIDFVEGLVSLRDSEDRELAEEVLFDFIRSEEETRSEEELEAAVVDFLRTNIEKLAQEGLFDKDSFADPFSISYDGAEGMLEVFYRYEEMVLLDKPLMETLQEDLDKFCEKLFSE